MLPNIDFRNVTKLDYCCSKCNATIVARNRLCKHCFREIVGNAAETWTSMRPHIDELIVESQRDADYVYQFIEWIPYENFTNVEFVAQGGFSRVYKAIWKQGYWECLADPDDTTRYFERRGSMEVALKEQKHSVAVHLKLEHCLLREKQLYGLSVNPETGQIILVMRYMSGGDLRQLLIKNPVEFTWSKRIEQLSTLMRDLQTIHKAGFIHKDFHSGNVLWTFDDCQDYELCISDFGLSGPANNEDEKITGFVPYMAPELLLGRPKSTASDTYAFGIVMWEFSSGEPAFFECRDDDLAFFKQKITQDHLRPVPIEGTPDCYVNLMTRCWAPDPKDRPTAEEVFHTLLLFIEMNDITSPKFNDTVFEQFEMAEELRLQKGSCERFHHEIYTSVIIDDDEFVPTVEL
ncbi:3665_t:CDS:2 [Paraglomus brasilianum]|uniref:3665_t:CDS:1 n=1 Tax=Paraglomus brasilianum TaxID=144538 RepID=A0A9N9GNQ0_9GLOM|nr:3665_t:CDS:2 [Paraglomus brasilianum]